MEKTLLKEKRPEGKTLRFRIESLDGIGQVWFCRTVEYKNKLIARLDAKGYGYTVTREWM